MNPGFLQFSIVSRKKKLIWVRSFEHKNSTFNIKNIYLDKGPAKPILTWPVVQRKTGWGVLVLIGGGYAIAVASDESGFSVLGFYLNVWFFFTILVYDILYIIYCISNLNPISDWVANNLADLVESWDAWVICLLCSTMAACFTEVTSNSAACALFVPLLNKLVSS